ncbi:MAG: AAA family ATPase [Streptosporangiaceae bacterium]|nr:AAA family ATPase [Streptosporangiaceae bacterium]
MSLEATREQRAAREVFASGSDLALVAGAGTGKTSTLMMMAEATSKRGLYMAFNKTTADDAQRRFSRNVECRTAHSLAFAAVGRKYKYRLDAPRLPGRETMRLLGITGNLDAGTDKITMFHQARLVMGMVKRFCHSSATEVMARHMEAINGLEPAEEEQIAQMLLPYAQKAWQDICAPNGRLRFEHDHYMKMWALTQPELPGDFIMLDEAQDTNPVLEEIFLPVFAGSTDIGGADADFIVDGLLLDCKATTTPTRLGGSEIGQLAGYLLLDYDDRYRITQVGLYLPRQGATIAWQVPEFLRLLGTDAPLSELRGRLREYLRRWRHQ